MLRSLVCRISVAALVAASIPAHADERAAGERPVVLVAQVAKEDCEARISKLNGSDTEGDELLAEKDEVIGACASQYRNDKVITGLVKECRKYEEQPVVKQQALAECQLAAYKYANELRVLKAQYRK